MRALGFLLVLIAAPFVFVTTYEQGLLGEFDSDILLPPDLFIRAELAQVTGGADLSARVQKALASDEYDDAEMYADIADYMGADLTPEAKAELAAARSLSARATRGAGSFFEGFLTGEGSDTVGFAGAITSDLTVVGDVRDIHAEGSKLVAGEDYSQLILGLSVVGLGATTATIATGGAGLPARIGISILKVSKKAGTLTASFSRELSRLLSEAVNFPKLKRTLSSIDITDTAATRRAISDYGDNLSNARLLPVLEDMTALQRQAGPAESVRLMRYVETTADLKNIRRMSTTLGAKSRGVISLTGKTSLRAFKTLANLIFWIAGWVWAGIAALAGLFIARTGRRLIRRRA